MTLWDLMIVAMFAAGALMSMAAIKAMPPPDYKIRKRPYTWRMGRKNEQI